MQAHHGQGILSLTVSDANKELLLRADGFIRILIDSLLLDPDHPRRTDGKTDFEAVKGPVQRVGPAPACAKVAPPFQHQTDRKL